MNTTQVNRVTLYIDDSTLNALTEWIGARSQDANCELLSCELETDVSFNLDTYEEVTE